MLKTPATVTGGFDLQNTWFRGLRNCIVCERMPGKKIYLWGGGELLEVGEIMYSILS